VTSTLPRVLPSWQALIDAHMARLMAERRAALAQADRRAMLELLADAEGRLRIYQQHERLAA
jgi:hypothetical protein